MKMKNTGKNVNKYVENILAISEIAHNEQFFRLPQCFQNMSDAGASESVTLWGY